MKTFGQGLIVVILLYGLSGFAEADVTYSFNMPVQIPYVENPEFVDQQIASSSNSSPQNSTDILDISGDQGTVSYVFSTASTLPEADYFFVESGFRLPSGRGESFVPCLPVGKNNYTVTRDSQDYYHCVNIDVQ